MTYVFGKSIAIDLNPHIDGDYVNLYELVSARLYDEEPTDSEVDMTASGSAVQTVTGWVANSGNLTTTYTITFDPVTDSDPHSTESHEKYWLAYNFKYESGGPTVFDKEVLFIYRPDAWVNKVSVSASELIEKENKLDDFFTTAQLNAHIEEGKRRTERALVLKGLKMSQLFRRQELNDAVYYAALSSACRDLVSEDSPEWLGKAEYYEGLFKEIIEVMKLSYDADGDDNPDEDESNKLRGVFVFK